MKNNTDNEFLASIKGSIKNAFMELFPIFSPKEDDREPLTHTEFYAALSKTSFFKSLQNAEQVIFKDLLFSDLKNETGVILPDTQTNAISHALEHLCREYPGFTPSSKNGTKDIAKQLPMLVEGLSKEETILESEKFLSSSATSADYRETREYYSNMQANGEIANYSSELVVKF